LSLPKRPPHVRPLDDALGALTVDIDADERRHEGDEGRPIEQWYPRQDSNLRHWLRRPVLYPLSYGGVLTSVSTRFRGEQSRAISALSTHTRTLITQR